MVDVLPLREQNLKMFCHCNYFSFFAAEKGILVSITILSCFVMDLLLASFFSETFYSRDND